MSGDPTMLMLLHVVPLAAGAAVSPALLGASLEILITFGARGARMLLAYLLGSALVVAAIVALSAALPRRSAASTGDVVADVIDVVLAAILLIVAAVLLFRRPSSGENGTITRLLASKWVVIGVVTLGILMMVTNISILVILLAGAHEVVSADVGTLARVAGFGLLAVGSLLPILLPLVWVLVSPKGATRALQRINAFITEHGRMLGIVVCVVTAVYLLARGFGLI